VGQPCGEEAFVGKEQGWKILAGMGSPDMEKVWARYLGRRIHLKPRIDAQWGNYHGGRRNGIRKTLKGVLQGTATGFRDAKNAVEFADAMIKRPT
jgi:hypothetical protein